MPRDKKTTYKIMSSIKSKDTVPEKILGKSLWKLGLRYRKHYNILGKPDFVFVKIKIAVFCDGDFWHGNNWKLRGMESFDQELSTYNDFWREKIKRNIERDHKVNDELTKNGWLILRFWESDIRKSPETYAKIIMEEYIKRGSIQPKLPDHKG